MSGSGSHLSMRERQECRGTDDKPYTDGALTVLTIEDLEHNTLYAFIDGRKTGVSLDEFVREVQEWYERRNHNSC